MTHRCVYVSEHILCTIIINLRINYWGKLVKMKNLSAKT